MTFELWQVVTIALISGIAGMFVGVCIMATMFMAHSADVAQGVDE